MLWVKVTFLPKKNADFLQEIADVIKIKRVLTIKGTLRNKFQVSSIILKSFKQGEGGGGNLSPFPPQIEPLKSRPRLQWKNALTLQRSFQRAIFFAGLAKFWSIWTGIFNASNMFINSRGSQLTWLLLSLSLIKSSI